MSVNNKERSRPMPESNLKRTPVTLITGFLGAGKTTLLNRILSGDHGLRIAVLENEFANLNIDSSLIEKRDGDIIEMKNGCICCDLQGELQESLIKIGARRDNIDHVLIETTGLANPSPLVQILLGDPLIHILFELDSVVTIIDAKHFMAHWEGVPEFKDQISFADLILINKTDLCSAQELEQVEELVRSLNPEAALSRTQKSDYPLVQLFGRQCYDNDSVNLKLASEAKRPVVHGPNVGSISLEIHGPLEEHRFMPWFEAFLRRNHENLYRTKGIFQFLGYSKPVVLQGVHAIFQATLADHLQKEEVSRFVMIGKDLNRQEILEGIAKALPPSAGQGITFSSFSVPETNTPMAISGVKPWTHDPRIQLIQ
jgi:G3E family GTPase